MPNERLNQCLEALCQCGCDAVRATIAAMESGLPVTQVEMLDQSEQQKVLAELKAVMAVYDSQS